MADDSEAVCFNVLSREKSATYVTAAAYAGHASSVLMRPHAPGSKSVAARGGVNTSNNWIKECWGPTNRQGLID